MRRLALSLLPVTALWLACMQGPPGMDGGSDDEGGGHKLSDPDCRIGGTSVGCGNPTKGVAGMEWGAWECGALRCPTIGYPNPEFTVKPGPQLEFTWRPWDEETLQGLPAPDSASGISVKVRYGNQLWLLDSTTLMDTAFGNAGSFNLTFDAVCLSLDNPSQLCSKQGWEEIPLTVEVVNRFYALGEWHAKKAYVHDLQLLPEKKTFAWRKGGSDPVIHFASDTTGKYDTSLALSYPPIGPGGYRIVFIPGTDKSAVWCEDQNHAALEGIPVGFHPLRIMDVPAGLQEQWVPVFNLDTLYQETKVDSFFLDAAFSSSVGNRHCP